MTTTPDDVEQVAAPSMREVFQAAREREAARHLIYLVGRQRLGVLPPDQAVLMVTMAEDLQAQSEKLAQQADRLAALVRFADRLRDAMAAATSSAVRLDVEPMEEEIAAFLLTQARARASLVDRTRYRHTCRVCGMSTLTNPEYEKLVAHKRKADAAKRSIGVTFLAAGTPSPVVMMNALFAFRSQKPDYHCVRCQALDTDQTVVVFCPQCKAEYDKALLKKCPKCQFDFLAGVDLSDLWRPLDDSDVPAPAGEKLSELRLDDEVTMLAFLPDGRRMLTASSARSVQLWDVGEVEGPRSVWTFSVGGLVKVTKPVVALSPDGQWVAVAKPQTPRVRLLRAADGSQAGEMVWAVANGSTPTDVAFLPDGSGLVIANAYIEVWGLDGQRVRRMKPGAVTTPSCVAVSPDGSAIAAAAGSWSNNKVFVWTVDGDLLAKLSMHGSIADLTWTPSGSLALAIGGTAVLVTVPAGKELAQFRLDAAVTSVAVSPDGYYLAAASRDHSARVFDLRPGKEVARISRPDEVLAVAFAPDGRLAVGDAGKAVQFWAPAT